MLRKLLENHSADRLFAFDISLRHWRHVIFGPYGEIACVVLAADFRRRTRSFERNTQVH